MVLTRNGKCTAKLLDECKQIKWTYRCVVIIVIMETYVTHKLAAKIQTNDEAIGILTRFENKNVCCVYLIKIRP